MTKNKQVYQDFKVFGDYFIVIKFQVNFKSNKLKKGGSFYSTKRFLIFFDQLGVKLSEYYRPMLNSVDICYTPFTRTLFMPGKKFFKNRSFDFKPPDLTTFGYNLFFFIPHLNGQNL